MALASSISTWGVETRGSGIHELTAILDYLGSLRRSPPPYFFFKGAELNEKDVLQSGARDYVVYTCKIPAHRTKTCSKGE